jgi:hypothetical protein
MIVFFLVENYLLLLMSSVIITLVVACFMIISYELTIMRIDDSIIIVPEARLVGY